MNLQAPIMHKLISKIYEVGYNLHLTRKLELRTLQRWITFTTDDKVCDIGCGKGILDLIVSRRRLPICGLDLDRENIKLARLINQRTPNDFIMGQSEQLPFKSGIFDKVICNCALEHFHDDKTAISEMNRVLKPRGLLFLTVDSFSYHGISDSFKESHRKKQRVVNFYDLQSLNKKLDDAGFCVKNKEYYMTSRVSSFFLRVGAKLNFGPLFLLTFPISYPLTAIAEHFSNREGGYCLAVLAQKLR
jgi:ubiquinone/menaquinone biosynthesis C-methylase UbiE